MELINLKTKEVIATKVDIANNFKDRLFGLIAKKELPPKSALVIEPCNWIHTFFLRYAIDVVYLCRKNRVVDYEVNVPPNKIGKYVKKASKVIELPAGEIKGKVFKGDVLVVNI